MTKIGPIVLVLIVCIAVVANVNAEDNPGSKSEIQNNPSSLTNTGQIQACSSCPDATKTVIEAYRDFGKLNKETYDSAISTIDTVAAIVGGVLGGGIIVLGGILSFLGIKEYKDVREKIKEITNELKVKSESIDNQKKELEGSNLELEKLLETQITEVKKTILLSKFVHRILGESLISYSKITEYIGNKDKTDQSKLDYAIEKTKDIIEEYERKDASEQKTILEYAGTEQLAWAYNIYGTGQHLKGNLLEASKRISRATELNPKNADAFYNLACTLEKVDKHEEALQALEEAISINPALKVTARTDPDLKTLKDGKYSTRFEKICG